MPGATTSNEDVDGAEERRPSTPYTTSHKGFRHFLPTFIARKTGTDLWPFQMCLFSGTSGGGESSEPDRVGNSGVLRKGGERTGLVEVGEFFLPMVLPEMVSMGPSIIKSVNALGGKQRKL